MTTTPILAGVCGVGFAAGLILIVLGIRGTTPAAVTQPNRIATWWLGHRQRTSPRWLIGAVTAGILAGLVTGWVVGGALVAIAVWALPGVLGGNSDHTHRVARIDGIAGWTEMLRDTIAAAAGLEQAILATVATAPAAIRDDVRELAVRIERGDRLAPALRELADDLADPTADLVVSALVLAAEHQARQLAELLGELAGEAREQVSMRLRTEADRARNRTSIRVIVGTTIVFAGGLVALNRGYLAPFNTAIGQVALLVVGGLFGLAFWWLSRLTRLHDRERFLTDFAAVDSHRQEVTS